jgi:hypothetical protein
MRATTLTTLPTTLALITLLIVAGCAVEPASYVPKTANTSIGYTDTQLTADRSRITLTGNASTNRKRVEIYLLIQSAQMTLSARRNWFMVDTGSTGTKTTYFSTFSGWQGWHTYGR